MPRRPRLIASAALLATVLAGCGAGTVHVSVAKHASDPACAAVSRHWPKTVSGHRQRDTSADSATVHAWGDPPIIARCGVSPPAANPTCEVVNGVDWVYIKLSDGAEFVTFGRNPAVEVLIPHHYAPEPLLLPAFTAAARQIPQGPQRCTG